MPELTLSPSQGSMNSATGLIGQGFFDKLFSLFLFKENGEYCNLLCESDVYCLFQSEYSLTYCDFYNILELLHAIMQ
jgi:hypothetical protein